MNGLVTYATDTTSPFDYQTTATYSCDTGYGMSGGDTVRTCVSSTAGPGEWSGTVPTCEGVYSCVSNLVINYGCNYQGQIDLRFFLNQ